MKILVMLMCMFFATGVYAECATSERGKVVCGNDEKAAGYNANTGTAYKAEKGEAGVTTTQTSRGGKAKTKNGVGVYQSPSGKTCVKTRKNAGCN